MKAMGGTGIAVCVTFQMAKQESLVFLGEPLLP
jgi:hypothetical protein